MMDRNHAAEIPRSNRIATVPNAISALRLAMAVALPFVETGWRLPLLIAGALSDWLDGLIAHLTHSRSIAGQLLDPLADKSLFLSALLTLLLAGEIEWWQVVLAMLRDFAVLVIVLYTTARKDWPAFKRMRPSVLGKLTTVLLFVWLVATLWTSAEPVRMPAFIATCVLSAVTAAEYLARMVRALREQNRRPAA